MKSIITLVIMAALLTGCQVEEECIKDNFGVEAELGILEEQPATAFGCREDQTAIIVWIEKEDGCENTTDDKFAVEMIEKGKILKSNCLDKSIKFEVDCVCDNTLNMTS